MRTYPLVTVITPAYNRASLLEETIQSVLGQDYPNLEYIVLDDGSTDGTLEVIKKYDGKIRWDTHQNVGETRTLNKGFRMARGEIIGNISSDDLLLPGAIKRMVERLLADPALLVVYPDWSEIDLGGRTIRHQTTFDYDYLDMLRRHHCIPGPGAFCRRSVIEQLGGRDPSIRYAHDLDFWLRAGLLGPFARVPETLASYRVHPNSLSVNSRGAQMADEHVRMVKKLYALPNLPPEVRKVKREAFSSAYYIAACEGPAEWRRKLFIRALVYDPAEYLGKYRWRLSIMLPEILGGLYTFSQRAWNSLNYKAGRLRKHLKF